MLIQCIVDNIYVRSSKSLRCPICTRRAEEGKVENVERFGLENGQVVAISRRVTDSNIKGVGFLRQLLGNIGRLRADQFVE